MSQQEELAEGLLDKRQADVVEGCPGCKCAATVRPGAPLPKTIMLVIGSVMLCNTLPVQILYPYLYFMVEDLSVETSKIGTYAGLIASSFLMGRTVTSIPWGIFGDIYGRKVVLIIGMLSLLVFNTWFGLVKSFAMAITTRFLLGAFSGISATLAAYSIEVVSDEHRPFSLSLLNSMWGVGLFVGPAIGGYLAQPAESFEVFKDTLFERFPYFLPPLVVSLLGVVVLTLLVFLLPETLHNHSKPQVPVVDGDVIQGDGSLLKNYPFWISNFLFCIWAFEEMAFNETFALWAVSPGGLRFTSQDVGFILAMNGLFLLCSSLLIYPRLAKRFTPIAICRSGVGLSLPLLAAFPVLEILHVSVGALTIVTVIRSCLASLATVSFFLLVNNSVIQQQRGKANGINACMVSLARALGPSIGGSIFSLAQSRPKAPFLPGNQLIFFFIAVFAAISFLGTWESILPRSTNKPK